MLRNLVYLSITCSLLCCGPVKKQELQNSENQVNIDWNEYFTVESELTRVKVNLEYFLKNHLDTISIDDANEYRDEYTQEKIEKWGVNSFEDLVDFSIKFPSNHITKLINHLEYTAKMVGHMRSSKELSYEIQKDRAAFLFSEYVELSGHSYAFKENIQISDFPWIPSYEKDVYEKVDQIFENIYFFKD